MAVNFFYNYNRQIDPPAPLVNAVVRNPRANAIFVNNPALIDPGAGCSVITPKMAEQLQPPRSGTIYVEGYKGKGDFLLFIGLTLKFTTGLFVKSKLLSATAITPYLVATSSITLTCV